MQHPYTLRRLLGTALLVGLTSGAFAQTQNVGIGTTTPNAKAALDVSATDKGLLVPRLTAAQRTAITSPPDGLMVFQTDGTTGFWYFFGGAWVNIPNANTAGDNLGNHTATTNLNLGANKLVGNGGTVGINISNAGNVGINQPSPGFQLHVGGTFRSNLTNGTFSLYNNAIGGGTVLLGALDATGGAGAQLRFSGAGGVFTDVGQNSSGDFVVEGNDAARMVVQNTGNVGIGIATPGARLDIQTTARTGTHPTGLPLYVTTNSSPASNGVEFRHDNGTQGIGFGYNSIYAAGTNASQDLNLMPKGTGSVGIGTTTPSALLDVNGTTRLRGLTTAGLVTTDASGNLGSATAASLDATTASNGLTKTGTNIALGGTLTGNTTINQGGNLLTMSGTNGTVSFNDLTSGGGTILLSSYTGTSLGPQVRFRGVGNPLTSFMDIGQNSAGDFVVEGSDVARMVVQNTGNVGIGATTPNTRLSITPSTTEAKITLWDGGNTTDHYGFGVSGNQLNYHVDVAASRHVFYAGGKNGNGTELMRIQGNGQVGIGTPTPGATFGVNGNVNLTNTSGSYTFNQFGGSGDVLLGTYTGASSNGPQLRFTGAPGFMDIGQNAAGAFVIEGNDNPRLTVLNAGNVGIGIPTPSALLDVNGTTRLRGLTTAGVVTTDASGNLSSATAASLDPTTASNGLTKTGTDIALGGTLTAATTVAQGGNTFAFTGGNVGIGINPAKRLHVDAGSDFLRIDNLSSVPSSTTNNYLVIDGSGNVGKTTLENVSGQIIRLGFNGQSYFENVGTPANAEAPLRFDAHSTAALMGLAPNGAENFISTITGSSIATGQAVAAGNGTRARTTDQITLPAGVYRVTVRLVGSYLAGASGATRSVFVKCIVNNNEYSLVETLNATGDGVIVHNEVSDYLNLSASSTIDFSVRALRNFGTVDRLSPGTGNSYRSLLLIERVR